MAHKKRILVVDDEPAIRILLSEVLTDTGYAVTISDDGVRVIEELKRKRDEGYDLIISDVNMPKMNGLDLCRRIVEEFPNLEGRFIFATGNITEELVSFFRAHNYRYILKPFRTPDLLREAGEILDGDEKITPANGCQDKRREKRFPWSAYCHLFEEKIYYPRLLVAKTLDISQHGFKIRYGGRPLATGGTVDVHIVSLNIRRPADLVWSKTIDDFDILAGLKFREPIQLPGEVTGGNL